MAENRILCVICAWRGDCQKRFRFESSLELRCPDYSRDMTIKDNNKEDKELES